MKNIPTIALLITTLPLIWFSMSVYDGSPHLGHIFSRLWPFVTFSLIAIILLATPYGTRNWIRWLALMPILLNILMTGAVFYAT